MLFEHRLEYGSPGQVCAAVRVSLRDGKETMWSRVRKARVDAGEREGFTTPEDEKSR